MQHTDQKLIQKQSDQRLHKLHKQPAGKGNHTGSRSNQFLIKELKYHETILHRNIHIHVFAKLCFGQIKENLCQGQRILIMFDCYFMLAYSHFMLQHMSSDKTKPTQWHGIIVCPEKTWISLGFCPV